jgi:hypothetical protein
MSLAPLLPARWCGAFIDNLPYEQSFPGLCLAFALISHEQSDSLCTHYPTFQRSCHIVHPGSSSMYIRLLILPLLM